MPKERRQRSGAHQPSVKLNKRQFAAQDNAVEHVEVGGAIQASGEEILEALSSEIEPQSVLKKKEKQQMKREAFLQRLETTHSPYSKSHNRRLKRKAKEQIAGGLTDMQATIAALDTKVPVSIAATITAKDAMHDANAPVASNKAKVGLTIGAGKGVPLSKAQRKRALKMEQLRHPLIIANPDYASNPFETIRIHAQNTLVKHEILS